MTKLDRVKMLRAIDLAHKPNGIASGAGLSEAACAEAERQIAERAEAAGGFSEVPDSDLAAPAGGPEAGTPRSVDSLREHLPSCKHSCNSLATCACAWAEDAMEALSAQAAEIADAVGIAQANIARAEAAEAEVEKMRAVVEAAKAIVNYEQNGGPDYQFWQERYDDLEKALASHAAEKGGAS